MVIRLSLSMAIPSDFNRSELHGVVFGAESSSRQQEPQNLRISLCGPAGHEVEQQNKNISNRPIKLLSGLSPRFEIGLRQAWGSSAESPVYLPGNIQRRTGLRGKNPESRRDFRRAEIFSAQASSKPHEPALWSVTRDLDAAVVANNNSIVVSLLNLGSSDESLSLCHRPNPSA